MALRSEQLKAWPFGPIEHRYAQKDVMLYALGIGVGGSPTDTDDLRFVYEDGLQVLPSFALVMGYPGFWLKDPATGVDWQKVLNAEQGIELLRPLPPSGHVIGLNRVEEIVDKGPGKGASIYTSRDIIDAASKEVLCRVTQTIFARGDGGFGGSAASARPASPAIPDRSPDLVHDMKTLPQAALIYRLSGDYNPLHADPAVARGVGFDRPILHGAASFGIAAYALLKLVCQSRSENLRRMNVRFSAPVYPGETIRTEVWKAGPGQAMFRCRVVERDVVVLNGGTVEFAEAGASR